MSEYMASPEEYEAGFEFYTSQESYVPFTLAKPPDMRPQVACIDPRDTDQAELTVDLQSPGGTVGAGMDVAVVQAVYRGYGNSVAWSLNKATEWLRSESRPGAHQTGCKYDIGKVALLGMMSDALTNDTFEHPVDTYGRAYFRSPRSATRALEAAGNGASIQRAHMEQAQAELREPELAYDMVRSTSEDKRAVPAMTSDNKAQFYVVNHVPLGLDRHAALRSGEPLAATAYHDNLGADIRLIDRIADGTLRDDLVAARMLRTIVTRQAVAGSLRHIDVTDADDRLRFDVSNS